ncbi:MAG: hypothetical protein K8S25_04535, partial [Alphaproteobacteria bacterium]|nr:hypothetical protein [Alphaproteobacteria bacterium]
MAAQDLALKTSLVQPHAVKAVHRGVAFFLFLRFLSARERKSPFKIEIPALDADGLDDGPGEISALIDFALRDNSSAPSGKPADRTKVLLKALAAAAKKAGPGASAKTLSALLQELYAAHWQATLGFTFNGLKAVDLHPATLQTFPEAFQQGMAARAHLLGDAGASAPDRWQGALGDRRVHALLTLSSPQLQSDDLAARAELRARVREFNTGRTAGLAPSVLRANLNAAAVDLAGVEILHIELGEDP